MPAPTEGGRVGSASRQGAALDMSVIVSERSYRNRVATANTIREGKPRNFSALEKRKTAGLRRSKILI